MATFIDTPWVTKLLTKITPKWHKKGKNNTKLKKKNPQKVPIPMAMKTPNEYKTGLNGESCGTIGM